jgi:DNA-binding Lrp family transcriptional regulator
VQQLERDLLCSIQHDFPLDRHPFAIIADRLGISEAQCIRLLADLTDRGILREIRPVINWKAAGFTGILIGMQVNETKIDDVASAINTITGVTHNYRREGKLNLWCTLTYENNDEKLRHLAFIRSLEGVVDLKEFVSEKTYKIGLVLDV